MKERITSSSEIKEVEGEIPVWYLYTSGIAGEKFFQGLKQCKLIGVKCNKCGKIFLPPKIYCLDCFKELTEKDFIEIPNECELHSFTIVNFDLNNKPLREPEIIGFVKFKNVTGGLIQRLKVKKPRIGMKLKVMFDKVTNDNLFGIYFIER
jgi:uncharacterized OB-fold protein